MKIPKIKDRAQKLIFVCLALIGAYLIYIVAYANFSSEPLRHLTVYDMLHSAFLATVISLGGGLLLDCEIRLAENK